MKKLDQPENFSGLFLCTDGGCQPNPGFGGWGFHGYKFSIDPPKKGIGLGSTIATSQGYRETKDAVKIEHPFSQIHQESIFSGEAVPVTVEMYVNSFGSAPYPATNNSAEMTGILQAFQYAIGLNIQFLQIDTDSKYVIQGVTNWMKHWFKNGWLDKEGNPVKNQEIWKQIHYLYHTLIEKGVICKIKHVYGHNGERANEIADQLATIGVNQSKNDPSGRVITPSLIFYPPEGFWNTTSTKHPFFAHRCAYFNTLPETHRPCEYYLGNHDKDDDLAFKKIPDGSYALIRLNEPDPLLEQIRSIQVDRTQGSDSIFVMYLDQIFSPSVYKNLVQFGSLVITLPETFRRDIWYIDNKIPITHEFKPARLIMRSAEVFSELTEKLSDFLSDHPSIQKTDITHKLYETEISTVKKKKIVEERITTKLKNELGVGVSYVKVQIDHPILVDQTDELTLTFDIDLLNRNALKRIESLHPQVFLITWKESDFVYRYATVIKCDTGVGIWCGYYSNIRIVSPIIHTGK